MGLQVRTVESMPFAENSYVVWLEGRTDAVVIDPGLEPESILDALADDGLTCAAVLNTHGHADHIAGNAALKRQFPEAPLIIGTGDAPMLADPVLNLSVGYGFEIVSPPADKLVNEGDVEKRAGIDWEVLEIPGHSPGHVVFVVRDGGEVRVFGGDVLFRGSVGRTDFPGGSFERLAAGIAGKLWPLPAATVVYPGHGPTTTVGHEMKTNPFVGQR